MSETPLTAARAVTQETTLPSLVDIVAQHVSDLDFNVPYERAGLLRAQQEGVVVVAIQDDGMLTVWPTTFPLGPNWYRDFAWLQYQWPSFWSKYDDWFADDPVRTHVFPIPADLDRNIRTWVKNNLEIARAWSAVPVPVEDPQEPQNPETPDPETPPTPENPENPEPPVDPQAP